MIPKGYLLPERFFHKPSKMFYSLIQFPSVKLKSFLAIKNLQCCINKLFSFYLKKKKKLCEVSSLTEATAYCNWHGYPLPHPNHRDICSHSCLQRRVYTQALGKQRQQPLPTGTSQLRHPLLVCRLSLPPNSTASAAVGVVRGQLLPTHRFPNGHFTTTRRGYLENWLSRARLLSGQDCHKIRLPLELKGPHRGGQGGRRKQRKARMLWALLRGLSVNLELVNCFLKFTILLKTGVISSSP